MARAVEERRRHRRRPKQRQEEAMREHGILAKKMNVIVSKDKITEKDPKTGYFSVVRKVTEKPVLFLPHPLVGSDEKRSTICQFVSLGP